MIKLAKKKQIVISDEELKPTTLAVIEDKKKASIFGIIWLFIIFFIFIISVIYLPEITTYINNYFNKEEVEPIYNNTKNEEEEKEDEKEEVKQYFITSDLSIKEEKFILSNFTKEDNTLKFSITNLTSDILNMKDMHYFMQIYNDNKKLLKRIYLQDIISPNEKKDITYNLDTTDATIISLTVINEDEYPAYVPNQDEENKAILTCNKDYEKIEYLLNNNKVYVTNIIYEVPVSDPNFNTLLNNYELMKTNYDTINGVSSTIEVGSEYLKFKTIINLLSIDNNTLNLKVIYPYNKDAKVIYFELVSSGYTCN